MTKHEMRFVRSLADKRARDEAGVFVVEGRKGVEEFVRGGFTLRHLFSTATDGEHISPAEMARISHLKTPTEVLAVVEMPGWEFSAEGLRGSLVLALDDVQNPGNVGTIVRLADWFGICDIMCSRGTADVWGPKVVQATMGSLARVRVHYGELSDMIAAVGGDVYGTFMDGYSVYDAALSRGGIVVLGNEGGGISPAVARLTTERLSVPRLGGGESLNVAVAAAIICSEFRRR